MDIQPKTDDDVQMGMMQAGAKKFKRCSKRGALQKQTGHW